MRRQTPSYLKKSLPLKVCIFTGAVASIEYITLALYFIRKASIMSVEPILSGIPHHLFKGFLLFLTGVVTGLVTLQIRKRIFNSLRIVQERNRISRTYA